MKSHFALWTVEKSRLYGEVALKSARFGAGVKCEVLVCKVIKCEVRCDVGCDWSVAIAGHLALYPTIIKLHRRRRLSRGGLLNGRQSSTSRLTDVAVVAQRIRRLLN